MRRARKNLSYTSCELKRGPPRTKKAGDTTEQTASSRGSTNTPHTNKYYAHHPRYSVSSGSSATCIYRGASTVTGTPPLDHITHTHRARAVSTSPPPNEDTHTPPAASAHTRRRQKLRCTGHHPPKSAKPCREDANVT